MKTGKSLTELAQEIERRRDAKADFIAPAAKIEMVVERNKPALVLDNPGSTMAYGINPIAHGQLAEYTGIPKAYYDRMVTDDPGLLATNVNRWLHDARRPADFRTVQGDRRPRVQSARQGADKRLVRTLDGNVRALLSSAYRRLENEDVAETVLPVLMAGNFDIPSCEITESRLYIKAVSRDLERQVPKGHAMGDGTHTIFDCVCPAITVGNSEVGLGALFVEFGIFTRACTNLAMMGASMRKYHVGARADVSEDVYALLTDETKRATDTAVFGQVRDLVTGAFDALRFDATVQKLTDATGEAIGTDVVEVVERVGKRFAFGETERKGVLATLIQGGDLSRYGLHAAITRYSADVDDYDRASELERIGGSIIELPKSEFVQLLAAA